MYTGSFKFLNHITCDFIHHHSLSHNICIYIYKIYIYMYVDGLPRVLLFTAGQVRRTIP